MGKKRSWIHTIFLMKILLHGLIWNLFEKNNFIRYLKFWLKTSVYEMLIVLYGICSAINLLKYKSLKTFSFLRVLFNKYLKKKNLRWNSRCINTFANKKLLKHFVFNEENFCRKWLTTWENSALSHDSIIWEEKGSLTLKIPLLN